MYEYCAKISTILFYRTSIGKIRFPIKKRNTPKFRHRTEDSLPLPQQPKDSTRQNHRWYITIIIIIIIIIISKKIGVDISNNNTYFIEKKKLSFFWKNVVCCC